QIAPTLLGTFEMIVVGHLRRSAVRTMDDRVAAIMQIGIGSQHARGFYRSIRHALRPADAVPEYFQAGADANLLRRARTENICQMEDNSFLAAGGEAQIVLRNDP